MVRILFITIFLATLNAQAAQEAMSTHQVKPESAMLNKKFALNLTAMPAAEGVIGARASMFQDYHWGPTVGIDVTPKTTTTLTALTYRWSPEVWAIDTLAVRAGAYYLQGRSGANVVLPFRAVFEFESIFSLAPRLNASFILLGFSTKTTHTNESSEISRDLASGLFRVGYGLAF